MIEPYYPIIVVECGACGKEFDAEIGECTRCRGGVITEAPIVYVPLWHYKQSGMDVPESVPELQRAW